MSLARLGTWRRGEATSVAPGMQRVGRDGVGARGRHGGGLDKACVLSFSVEDDSDGTQAGCSPRFKVLDLLLYGRKVGIDFWPRGRGIRCRWHQERMNSEGKRGPRQRWTALCLSMCPSSPEAAVGTLGGV